MTQIKLSIAFVLAAAAIAPVVAQPVRDLESHEYPGHVGFHHHHDRLHRHHHLDSIPEATSDSDIAPMPSRREYADEFDARDFLFGQNDVQGNSVENQEKTLEQEHQFLETDNKHLERKNRRLSRKERHLEHKDHRLAHEEGELEHTKHSLENQDDALLAKKHRLQDEDSHLRRKRKALKGEDKTLEAKRHSLLGKNKALRKKAKKLVTKGKALAHKDKKLEHKGEVLTHHDNVLAEEGDALAHKDQVLAQKGKALAHNDRLLAQEGKAIGPRPVVHSESEIVAREFDDVFERRSDDVESGNTLPHFRSSGLHSGPGPANFHSNRPFRRPGGPGLGLRPVNFPHRNTGLFGSYNPFLGPIGIPHGHGPVVFPHDFGPRPARHGPARPTAGLGLGVSAREYVESNDMIERDFEDVEIDAREFDDELYLD